MLLLACLTVSCMELHELRPPDCFQSLAKDKINCGKVSNYKSGVAVWKLKHFLF
jgi:hypothetical protein